MLIMHVLDMTVIIPTLSRPNSLRRTLEVMNQYEFVPAQIVVVDQSPDIQQQQQNREMSKYCPHTEYTYLYLKKPSSTKARNCGVGLAQHEILVFMDDDVDVNSSTLQQIYERMLRTDVAMLGAIDENLPVSRGILGYIFDLKSIRYRRIGHVTASMHGRYPAHLSDETKTMWVMGFCFSVKKSLLEKWDVWFDEKLTGYAYAEDLDFSFSYFKCAEKEGKKCILSKYITVKHMESLEYRIPTSSVTYRYIINRQYLAYKHGMKLSNRCALVWSNFGQFLLRMVQRARPLDMLRAQHRCLKVNKFLKQGILSPLFYEATFNEANLKME